MAIIYTYPKKSDPSSSDLLLISDSEDNNKTKQVTIHDIRGATTSGVSSIIAGTNVTIDPAAGTGDVTINSTSPAPSKVVETVRNISGSMISKGQPLHITGVSGTIPTVEVADAGDERKMPVSGLASEDIADNSNGSMILSGILDGINTSGLDGSPEEAAVVYVNNNTGGSIDYLTTSDTTISGQENSVQNIGIIVKNSAGSSGSIQVTAIGRANATPNLDKGSLFVGNNNNLSRPLGVGTNGHVLTADSTQSSGLSWQAISSVTGHCSVDWAGPCSSQNATGQKFYTFTSTSSFTVSEATIFITNNTAPSTQPWCRVGIYSYNQLLLSTGVLIGEGALTGSPSVGPNRITMTAAEGQSLALTKGTMYILCFNYASETAAAIAGVSSTTGINNVTQGSSAATATLPTLLSSTTFNSYNDRFACTLT